MAACADTNFPLEGFKKLSTNKENEQKRDAIKTQK